MRLIDADELMRIIIHRSYSVTDYWNNRDAGMFLYGIEQAVNELPVVDAEHVIRCRDCKYWTADDEERTMYCGEEILPTVLACTGNGYCSFAERKEK